MSVQTCSSCLAVSVALVEGFFDCNKYLLCSLIQVQPSISASLTEERYSQVKHLMHHHINHVCF